MPEKKRYTVVTFMRVDTEEPVFHDSYDKALRELYHCATLQLTGTLYFKRTTTLLNRYGRRFHSHQRLPQLSHNNSPNERG